MKNINERNNFVFEFRPVTELFEEQVKLQAGGDRFRRFADLPPAQRTGQQDCQCTCGKRCQTGDHRRCGS